MIDKKLSKRILAYIIDSTIVLLLTVLITNIKYLNPTYDNALEKSNELQSLNLSNIEIQNYLPLYYKDSEISEDEYNDLIKDRLIFKITYKDYKNNEKNIKNMIKNGYKIAVIIDNEFTINDKILLQLDMFYYIIINDDNFNINKLNNKFNIVTY